MTEELDVSNAHEAENGEQYTARFRAGLELADQIGFDLMHAVAANSGPKRNINEVAQRTYDVITTACELSEELGLDDSFFEKPANTILLTAVADSWIETKNQAQNKSHDPHIADERIMLADFALTLAGKDSATARSLANKDKAYQDRYIGVESADDKAQEEYLRQCTDEQLSNQVRDILKSDVPDSFLAQQRKIFNITSDNEEPFEIRVLAIGEGSDFRELGLLAPGLSTTPHPGLNSPEEELDAYKKKELEYSANRQSNAELVEPYEANLKVYNKRFGETHGKLAPAVTVRNAEGGVTLYIRAPQAIALAKYAETGQPFTQEAMGEDLWDVMGRTIKHEYGHTQKNLTLGARSQLGMILEERKAELASGDKGGYKDVAALMMDIQLASKAPYAQALEVALGKDGQNLDRFLSWSSKNIGLRSTLLIMAGKPDLYGSNPSFADLSINISHTKDDGDHTELDAIVRRLIDTHGAHVARQMVHAMYDTQVKTSGIDALPDAGYFSWRRNEGKAHHMTRYMEEEINNIKNLHINYNYANTLPDGERDQGYTITELSPELRKPQPRADLMMTTDELQALGEKLAAEGKVRVLGPNEEPDKYPSMVPINITSAELEAAGLKPEQWHNYTEDEVEQFGFHQLFADKEKAALDKRLGREAYFNLDDAFTGLPNDCYEYMDTVSQIFRVENSHGDKFNIINFTETPLTGTPLQKMMNAFREIDDLTGGASTDKTELVVILPKEMKRWQVIGPDSEVESKKLVQAAALGTGVVLMNEQLLQDKEAQLAYEKRDNYSVGNHDLEAIIFHEEIHILEKDATDAGGRLAAEDFGWEIPRGTWGSAESRDTWVDEGAYNGPSEYSKVDAKEDAAESGAAMFVGGEWAHRVSDDRLRAMAKLYARSHTGHAGPTFIRCTEKNLSDMVEKSEKLGSEFKRSPSFKPRFVYSVMNQQFTE